MRIVSAWVHNGQAGDVESVMVDGRWLMRDRTVLTIAEADVVTRAKEIGRQVWRQLVERYPNVPFQIKLPPPVSWMRRRITPTATAWPAARSWLRWMRSTIHSAASPSVRISL